MNTVSIATSCMGVPGVSPMYSRARAADSRAAGSAKLSGSGTLSVTATDCAGVVPQVTVGASAAASMATSRS